MSLELERQLIEMGVIPASPLEEIGIVAVKRESYNQLPQPEGRRLTGSSYDEETQEYMF